MVPTWTVFLLRRRICSIGSLLSFEKCFAIFNVWSKPRSLMCFVDVGRGTRTLFSGKLGVDLSSNSARAIARARIELYL